MVLGIGLELGIGLIELGIGLRIHVSLSFHSLSYSSTVKSIELGIGLIELGIGLRINNAGAPSWPVYPALLLLHFTDFSFHFSPKKSYN